MNQPLRVFKINHFFSYVEFVKISENFRGGLQHPNPTTSCATDIYNYSS
jgi:hypothetical protein